MPAPLPVTLLTGFLGSGKTTLLNQLLRQPEGVRAAVLINEFGAVGLDHLLARPVQGTKVLIRNGCVCCTVHESLRDTLRALLSARDRGEIPAFDRLLIETSGASDPMPIVMTLQGDPLFRHHLRLAAIVTTIDAHNGLEQIETQAVAARQAGMADHLVITKTDLMPDPTGTETLQQRLSALAPTAHIHQVPTTQNLWPALTEAAPHFTAHIRKTPASQNFRKISHPDEHGNSPEETAARWGQRLNTLPLHRAGTRLNSFSVVFARRPDWSRFSVWLSLLMHRHGTRILRIKGLLNVKGMPGPMLLNVVQHFIHPPEHLDTWPDDDERSRLVFITDGIDEQAVQRALFRILDVEPTFLNPLPEGPDHE